MTQQRPIDAGYSLYARAVFCGNSLKKPVFGWALVSAHPKRVSNWK